MSLLFALESVLITSVYGVVYYDQQETQSSKPHTQRRSNHE